MNDPQPFDYSIPGKAKCIGDEMIASYYKGQGSDAIAPCQVPSFR